MANLFTTSAFPTPLSCVNFGNENRDLNRRLLLDSFQEKEQMSSSNRSGVGAWQSQLGMEKKYKSFRVLGDLIDTSVKASMPVLGFGENLDKTTCANLWVNIIDSVGSFHLPHIHGSGKTLFSGVYYPSSGMHSDLTPLYPDEDLTDNVDVFGPKNVTPGDLVLFDPAMTIKSQVTLQGLNKSPFYGESIVIRPRESQLVIFPNYLQHMVMPVIDNSVRISISFSFEII